ncbi:MAG: ArsC family reductase [Pseudomonadota bacterium]
MTAASTIHLYGICNCDTVKKARAWLDAAGVDHVFHDYKVEGVDPARLAAWVREVGWEVLLNRAGTTFRKLDDSDRADLDADKALRLMAAHPSLIKRPLVEYPGGLLVGFKPDRYAAAFA